MNIKMVLMFIFAYVIEIVLFLHLRLLSASIYLFLLLIAVGFIIKNHINKHNSLISIGSLSFFWACLQVFFALMSNFFWKFGYLTVINVGTEWKLIIYTVIKMVFIYFIPLGTGVSLGYIKSKKEKIH